ncbi:outer membrane lipoprotein carrier protein LolA [Microbulbifer sp. S227A]|uniref:outer membrane lipoprotein carrier protein LolA n=1 Tax=Microbulbifer sp. S227A TaxID=3415131 RepID=UPI003C797762
MIRLLLCLVLLACPASADPVVAAGDVLTASFQQTRQMGGALRPVHSRGRFLLFPERGVIWHTSEPVASYLVIDDQAMWQSVDGRKTRKIALRRVPEARILQTVLKAVLMRDWQQIEDRFGTRPRFDGARWKMTLDTGQGGRRAARITLTGTTFVERIDVRRNTGGHDVIEFADFSIRPARDLAELERLF